MRWKSTALATTFTIVLTGTAHAAGRFTPPSVPTDLVVGDGHRLLTVGHAYGTQNYICAPAAVPGGVDWLFIGPQATIFDAASGRQIITHFQSKNPFKADAIQATWQHSRDSSIVWATRFNGSSDAAYVAPGAIEWLLLEMTGAHVGSTGGHELSSTRLIQRVNTVGGMKPPTSECTAATINTRKLVPYEADYYFYD